MYHTLNVVFDKEKYSDAPEQDGWQRKAYTYFLIEQVLEPAIKSAEKTLGKTDSQLRREILTLRSRRERELGKMHQVLLEHGLDYRAMKKLSSDHVAKRTYYSHKQRSAVLKRELDRLTASLHDRLFLKTSDVAYRLAAIFGSTRSAVEVVKNLHARFQD